MGLIIRVKLCAFAERFIHRVLIESRDNELYESLIHFLPVLKAGEYTDEPSSINP